MTSTAVTKTTDRDAALTREGKMHVAAIRASRALTIAITNEAWGTALSAQMRHAVAEYMRRHRLDVSEVDVLGGKIYRNGYYYRRRIAEMRTRGMVDWTDGEHIGPDARLESLMTSEDAELARKAKAEHERRLFERIRWAVPEDATHAYVVRIKLKGDQKVLEGCDWITPERTRKTKFGEKIADPIGAEEPEKTVITRAWRRAGLLAAAEIQELKSEEATLDAEAEVVEATVEQIQDEEDARAALSQRKPSMLASGEQPYGEVTTPTSQPREAETVVVSESQRPDPAVVQQGLALEDPYADDATPAPAPAKAEPKRSKAYLTPFPFGNETRGKPIGEFPSEMLIEAREGAVRRKMDSVVEAIDELFEERRLAALDSEDSAS
jgi:hypothetical protein